MWDLPRPGLEAVSPALAGGFLTTAPPGKPRGKFFDEIYFSDFPEYLGKKIVSAIFLKDPALNSTFLK